MSKQQTIKTIKGRINKGFDLLTPDNREAYSIAISAYQGGTGRRKPTKADLEKHLEILADCYRAQQQARAAEEFDKKLMTPKERGALFVKQARERAAKIKGVGEWMKKLASRHEVTITQKGDVFTARKNGVLYEAPSLKELHALLEYRAD